MPSLEKIRQPVKTVRRKPESPMSIRERAAVGARCYNADELRQKAREWLAQPAVNRLREDPEPA
jgi:ABC-type phosphonate transport system ATPase subunit